MLSHEEIRAAYDHGPEAIIALVESFCALIDQQQAQIAELRARVKALEDQLATNSRNSSKPPSSDSFTKQTRSLRQPSGRKSGGQPGHPGTTLQQVAVPDQTRIHEPVQCMACGASLAAVAGQPDSERRQVFDLPPLQLEVTAHRVLRKECAACGHRNCGILPEGVACGASYGAGVKRLLTYLNQGHLLPYARSCEIVADLFAQPVSEGLLEAAVNGCTIALAETETSIKQGLAHAKVVNFDETGMYVAGKRMWLHSASTPQLTHYACHDQRGATATKAIGSLPAFGGGVPSTTASAPIGNMTARMGCATHTTCVSCSSLTSRGSGRGPGRCRHCWGRSRGLWILPKHRRRRRWRPPRSLTTHNATWLSCRLAWKKSTTIRLHRVVNGGARNSTKARICWTGWRSTRPKRWPLCKTLRCPLTTIWPSGICG